LAKGARAAAAVVVSAADLVEEDLAAVEVVAEEATEAVTAVEVTEVDRRQPRVMLASHPRRRFTPAISRRSSCVCV
jgi:hypothetical protein